MVKLDEPLPWLRTVAFKVKDAPAAGALLADRGRVHHEVRHRTAIGQTEPIQVILRYVTQSQWDAPGQLVNAKQKGRQPRQVAQLWRNRPSQFVIAEPKGRQPRQVAQLWRNLAGQPVEVEPNAVHSASGCPTVAESARSDR